MGLDRLASARHNRTCRLSSYLANTTPDQRLNGGAELQDGLTSSNKTCLARLFTPGPGSIPPRPW